MEDAGAAKVGPDDLQAMRPHSKPNMPSPFGRLLDRATYWDLMIVASATLLVSSTYFWLAPQSQGALFEGRALTFPEAVYLSIVTFTSLGYGDVLPVGFGRVVAVLDVACGLLLTAVLIGKVASERQASLLLLLHTSDTQRRISAFAKELANIRGALSEKSESEATTKSNRAELYSLRTLTQSISNYMSFNGFQAGIVEFGNFSALSALYDELDLAFEVCSRIVHGSGKNSDAVVMARAVSCCTRIYVLVRLMSRLHRSAATRSSLFGTVLISLRLKKPASLTLAEAAAKNKSELLFQSMAIGLGKAEAWKARGYHSLQLERVLAEMPSGSKDGWGNQVHKLIAAKLGISNSVASKCVATLVELGRLPK